MSAVIPFDFDGSAVRVVMCGDAPWFVAKDVCGVLEIANHKDAVSRLDDDERRGSVVPTPSGGPQEMLTVSESGLYALIFTSRKPEAKRFRRWVTGEVLPAIHRTGRYSGPGRAALPHCADAQEIPPRFRALKPGIRAQVLNNAVQLVKAQGGGGDEVLEHFLRFCEWVAPASKLETALEGGNDVEALCAEWAEMHLVDDEGGKVQAKHLWASFKAWCEEARGAAPCSWRAFGTWMARNYDRHQSCVIWYKGVRLRPE